MSFKAYAVPFALLCKLCGAPDGELDSSEEEEPELVVDAAVQQEDASLPEPAEDAAALYPANDAARADAVADAGAAGSVLADAGAPSPASGAVERGETIDGRPGIPLCGPPGLFAEGSCSEISARLVPYTPRFPLWSDGTQKERYVQLPPRTVIDASDGDTWILPKGTRLYKTFSLNGVKLETRVMEKVADEPGVASWAFQAYAWNAQQTAVTLVPDTGLSNVLGTSHDIPSLAQCRVCHGAAGQDGANGFAAIQLNHEQAGALSLQNLIAAQRIRHERGRGYPAAATPPGDAETQAGLGVLHGNCGHCHGGPTPRAQLSLRLTIGAPDVASTPFYKAAVGVPLSVWVGKSRTDGVPLMWRALPGDPAGSGIVARMSARGSKDQMPSIGTEQVDSHGLAAVMEMIRRLPPRAPQ